MITSTDKLCQSNSVLGSLSLVSMTMMPRNQVQSADKNMPLIECMSSMRRASRFMTVLVYHQLVSVITSPILPFEMLSRHPLTVHLYLCVLVKRNSPSQHQQHPQQLQQQHQRR